MAGRLEGHNGIVRDVSCSKLRYAVIDGTLVGSVGPSGTAAGDDVKGVKAAAAARTETMLVASASFDRSVIIWFHHA